VELCWVRDGEVSQPSPIEKGDGFIFEENSPLTLWLLFGDFLLGRYF
jgi:hypothetical protein